MYDHDPEEVEDLGWEEFIARHWDSIFVGYRSWTGLRKLARRWSDLIEIGLGAGAVMAGGTGPLAALRGRPGGG